MNKWRKIYSISSFLIFALALLQAHNALELHAQGGAHFLLGTVFALLLLLRPKAVDEANNGDELPAGKARQGAVFALAGLLLVILGRFLVINQFSWLGWILLLYATLRMALPALYKPDIIRSLFVFYWIHPLPGQLAGPLQLWMQRVSVRGAEWVLHIVNFRVWADGLVLDSGTQLFGVPEACSGMTTAMTVFMCVLGVGLLLRFKLPALVVLLTAGIMQVLALNIARIAGMIYIAEGVSAEWTNNFLHDTLGSFLLLAVALSFCEAALWRTIRSRRLAYKQAVAAGSVEPRDHATILPPFWRMAVRWGGLVLFLLFLILATALAVYKNRPYHRGRMIQDIAEARLTVMDIERAHRAVNAALLFIPGDKSLEILHARVLSAGGRPAEALAILEQIKDDLALEDKVLKSNVLLLLGRLDDARDLLESLPEEVRKYPGIAVLLAEYASASRDVAGVIQHLPFAARTHVNIKRVRRLFPYLAAHEQWSVIAACDRPGYPYDDATAAYLSLRAHLVQNELSTAGNILIMAETNWPEDPRFLDGLVALSSAMPGKEWEDRFARRFSAVMFRLAPDPLAAYLRHALSLGRMDLAWVGYVRLQKIAPSDPDVYLVPAEFAGQWLHLRRHNIALPARGNNETIDISGFVRFTAHLPPWNMLWKNIPRIREVAVSAPQELRIQLLKKGLEVLSERARQGTLTRRMELSWPQALALSGQFDAAHFRLDVLEEKYPDMRQQILLLRAILFDQQGLWSAAYEAIRIWRSETSTPQLTADLITINALMNMNVAVAALEKARQTVALFPDAVQAELAEAAIWDVFGFKAYALHLLSLREERRSSPLYIRLLYETGRYSEAKSLARLAGVASKLTGLEAMIGLPPAEAVFDIEWPPPLSADDMQRQSEALQADLPGMDNVFMRNMGELMRDWYAARGGAAVSDPAQWAAAGRDELESAGLLHRLASLQARQGRADAANAAIQRALVLIPHSPVLWRMRIALAEKEKLAGIVGNARINCPFDPDIWLAELVLRDENGAAELRGLLDEVKEGRPYPQETFVRAADFLLRKERFDAARQMAARAIEFDRSYMPALLMDIRSAAAQKDWQSVLAGCLAAVEVADDPAPFFEVIVAVKSSGTQSDRDIIRALEYLHTRYPGDTEWAERMGRAYFEKGETERALSILGPLIDKDPGGVRMLSILLAAEAERQKGNPARALRILEEARTVYPERLSILNNMVYTMLDMPGRLDDAARFVPQLLALGGDNVAVLDTVSRIYAGQGRFIEAWEIMQKCLSKLEPDSRMAPEIYLNAAELLIALQDYTEADQLLTTVNKSGDLFPLLEYRARAIRKEMDAVIAREKAGN